MLYLQGNIRAQDRGSKVECRFYRKRIYQLEGPRFPAYSSHQWPTEQQSVSFPNYFTQHIASNLKVKEETKLDISVKAALGLPLTFMLTPCLASFSNMKMEAICFSETSVDFQLTTRRYVVEDINLYNTRNFGRTPSNFEVSGSLPGSGHVGFCDEQNWRWGRFSPRTSGSPAHLHSICFSTIIFTITRGWHISQEWPQCQ
jgi:hypothetical protein